MGFDEPMRGQTASAFNFVTYSICTCGLECPCYLCCVQISSFLGWILPWTALFFRHG